MTLGRAERRREERRNRIESHKGSLSISREELSEMKRKASSDASKFNVEALMTCFALAEHRLYGFGQKRIFRSLQYIDELMGKILDDTANIEDYKRELEDEASVKIKV